MKKAIKIGWIFTFGNEWYKIYNTETTVNENEKIELVRVMDKTGTLTKFEKKVIHTIINSKYSKYYDSKGTENNGTPRNMDGSGKEEA